MLILLRIYEYSMHVFMYVRAIRFKNFVHASEMNALILYGLTKEIQMSSKTESNLRISKL